MHTKNHIIYSTLFIILCYLLPLNLTLTQLFIIWISSWLVIDLDHAIRYSIITKDINPIKFWQWSQKKDIKWKKLSKKERNQYKKPIFIFHGIEPLIIILILGLKYSFFLLIFIGFIFHLILDLIDLFFRNEPLTGKISIIKQIVRNKNLRRF